jgi:hypothetical protein
MANRMSRNQQMDKYMEEIPNNTKQMNALVMDVVCSFTDGL